RVGESCVFATCDPTTWCADDGDGGSSCHSRSPDGTPCHSGGECTAGVCTSFQPLDGGGDFCGVLPLGASCIDSTECAVTAYCSGARADRLHDVRFLGVCTARLPLGQACTNEQFDDGCSDAGSCLGGVCTAAANDVGGPCDITLRCRRGQCS